MSLDSLEIAFRKIFSSEFLQSTNFLRIVWHDGEPLSVGVKFYKEAAELLSNYRKLRPSLKVQQVIQTNATLINEAFVEHFIENKFDVGVSIDGPEHIHNRCRVDKSGNGSFAMTLNGIQKLQKAGIRFATISVVTPESLEHAEEIYHFLSSLNPKQIGFNVEEQEGFNSSSSFKVGDEEMYLKKIESFFKKILQLSKKDGKTKLIREFKSPLEKLLHLATGVTKFGSELNEAFRLVSIGHNGDISTFSPELLPATHPDFGNFIFGNIKTNNLDDSLVTDKFKKVKKEIDLGIDKCTSECSFSAVCPGGEPSNKLFENNSFNSTETFNCRFRVKLINKILTEDMQKDLQLAQLI